MKFLAVQDLYQGHEVLFTKYSHTFQPEDFPPILLNKLLTQLKLMPAMPPLLQSLLGYPLLIQVESKAMLDPQIVAKWEQYLETELAPLAKDNRALVFQLYAQGEKYYESAYLNLRHDHVIRTGLDEFRLLLTPLAVVHKLIFRQNPG